MFIGSRKSDSAPSRGLGSSVAKYRRLLVACLAGLTALLTLTALAPEPIETQPTLVVARALPSGHTLAADDLTVAQWPSGFSVAAYTSPDEVIGKLTMGPIEAGEPVTKSRLVDVNLLASAGSLEADSVAAPVRLADAEQTALVRPGDRVDIIAARAIERDEQSAEVIAADAIVLTVPAREQGGVGGSLLAGGGAGGLDSKDMIVVAVSAVAATDIAAASTRSQLSIVLKPHHSP